MLHLMHSTYRDSHCNLRHNNPGSCGLPQWRHMIRFFTLNSFQTPFFVPNLLVSLLSRDRRLLGTPHSIESARLEGGGVCRGATLLRGLQGSSSGSTGGIGGQCGSRGRRVNPGGGGPEI